MIRVRCDALPIIDPGEEGRRIVWEGFSETYRDFGDWHTSEAPPWPFDGSDRPPLVDMLVGEKYTFASPEADDWLTFAESGGWRQRFILGIEHADVDLETIALATGRVWET